MDTWNSVLYIKILTGSKKKSYHDKEIQDIPSHLPEHEKAMIPFDENLTHKDGHKTLVQHRKQVAVFLFLSNPR